MKTLDIINIDNELGKIEDNIILEVGKWRGIGIDEVKTYYYIDNNYDLYYKEIRDNEKKDNLNEYKIYNNTNLTNKVLDYIDEIDN